MEFTLAGENSKDLYETWIDAAKLSRRLGCECTGSTAGTEKGSEYTMCNFSVWGFVVSTHTNKEITKTFIRKNWHGHIEKKNKSVFTLEFSDFSNGEGTTITLKHKRVPLYFFDVVDKFWKEEVFSKFPGCLGNHTMVLQPTVRKAAVISALIDVQKLGQGMKGTAKITDKNDNSVKIQWRGEKYNPNQASDVTIDIEEEGKKVVMKYVHRGIPISFLTETKTNWDLYLKKI